MRPFKKQDLREAAILCGEAFIDSPHIRYFFPDVSRRQSASASLFEMRIRYGLLYGNVHVTSSKMEGIAVWLPASHARMTMGRQIRSGGVRLYRAVGKLAVDRMTRVASHNEALRARHAPPNHCFLSILAVQPRYQRQGFGSQLLIPQIDKLDASETCAYLEVTEARLVPMYEHYGFAVCEQSSVPGSDLIVSAMTRTPR